MIKIKYQAVDGYREGKSFMSLKGAQKYAHDRVGAHPEMGSYYAVSGDGIGKVTVEGVSLTELFPDNQPAQREYRGYLSYEQMQGDCGNDYDERDEGAIGYGPAKVELDSNGYPLHRAIGCTCSVQQLERVGCECQEMPF